MCQAIRDRLFNVISQTFSGVTEKEMKTILAKKGDIDFEEDLSADSLDFMAMIEEVEVEFNMNLPDEKALNTFNSLVKFVKSQT